MQFRIQRAEGAAGDESLMAAGGSPVQTQTEVSEAAEEEAQAQSGGLLPPQVTERTTASLGRPTTQGRAAQGQHYKQWRQDKESEFERLERIVAEEPRDSEARKIGRYQLKRLDRMGEDEATTTLALVNCTSSGTHGSISSGSGCNSHGTSNNSSISNLARLVPWDLPIQFKKFAKSNPGPD